MRFPVKNRILMGVGLENKDYVVLQIVEVVIYW